MLEVASVVASGVEHEHEHEHEPSSVEEVRSSDWREVDRTLCGLARQRAALDVEEARWLRAAQRLQIWRELGCVSLLDYMERRLGYGPRAAQERLRVAGALEQLPALELALEAGELPFTAVRELSRVMTPETETAWLEAGTGKSVHEIEQLVSGHARGDRPDAPPDPELVTRVVRFDVRPTTYARLREARAALDAQRGERLDDDAFLAALCGAALDDSEAPDLDGDAGRGIDGDAAHGMDGDAARGMGGDAARGMGGDGGRGDLGVAVPATSPATGRAKFQIAVTVCERCDRGWQDGAGAVVELAAAEVERATCDAQWIGSVDGGEPARAAQDVPPRIRRLVWRRDHGRCRVPGCRSTRSLEIHHIVAREDGGSHDPDNLCLCCDAHHAAAHRGLIRITGMAPDRIVVERRHEARVHVGAPSQLDRVTLRVQAKAALVQLGYKKLVAAAAVEAANVHVGAEVTLERLIREALRRCSG